MCEELKQEQEETLAAERGRSPSGAASVGGPAEAPAQVTVGDDPQIVLPAVEGGPPVAVPPVREPIFPDLGDDTEPVDLADNAFPDEELFPEEPFEEPLRKPRLVGTGKTRRGGWSSR
jgi:hypothetical protein